MRQVPGSKYLGNLSQWIQDGGSFPHHQRDSPNHYALPVTLLLQISQYARYLEHLGNDSHRQVLGSVRSGGIQGFCVGLLSAIAVASPKSEADLGSAAAVGLRLAVCIGAYVDHDGIFSHEPNKNACVAIRWREGNVEEKTEVGNIIRSYSEVGQQLFSSTEILIWSL
ncbi:uncharacterized protein BCR38DRAFT_152977 [Pseudomassariella vexata]|uniref:Starter acyltransferase (SAT) domain-containing protein n=1 Tax=Pseudomassariella vexata TaxID=1141098 RepID=A0A1Y2E6K8_9PEZI|nr:uncharacterized protein BCR38DRAFT_152977 [Pseudomassariella vexata]ORY67213.1 hypothetical protein BCR38DRAFT_152977 [Pseudomassariella vexata]